MPAVVRMEFHRDAARGEYLLQRGSSGGERIARVAAVEINTQLVQLKKRLA